MKSLLMFFCLYTTAVFSQVNFIKTYSLFQDPEMYFVEPLKNGGYVISGKCQNTTDNTSDFCFMKTDASGNITWTKQFHDSTFSGSTPMNEWAATIREDADGNYIFGGSVDDPHYNSAGAYYGWMDSSGVLLSNVIKTTSWKTSVNALILEHNGNIISTRDDNEGAGNHANYLEVNNPSAQYISGSSCGNFSIAKQTLVKMPDGGYAGIGIDETYYFDPSYNNLPIVTRFDNDGFPIWNYRIHNEVYGSDSQYTALCATSDTGLLICGYTKSGISRIILTRFNSSGDSMWTKSIGGPLSEIPSSIQATNDGGYIIAGSIGDDVLLLKLDANCNEVWTKNFGGSAVDKAIYLQQTSDNGFIILANTSSYGNETVMLIRTDNAGNISNTTNTMGKVDPVKESLLYPDPFSSSIDISIPGNHMCSFTLCDMTGRIVFSKEILGEAERLDLSFLPAGVYQATMMHDGHRFSRKIVKI